MSLKTAFSWNVFGTLLKMGGGILLLPLLLKKLTTNEMGIWYLISGMGSLILVLDFGLSHLLMRSVAYASASRNENLLSLQASVTSPTTLDFSFSPLSVFKKFHVLYKKLTFAVLLLALCLGSLYLWQITPHESLALRNGLLAWIFYASGQCLYFFLGCWNGFLSGIGKQTDAIKSVVFGQGLFIGAACTLVFLFPSVLILCVSFFVGACISFCFSWISFLRYQKSAPKAQHTNTLIEEKQESNFLADKDFSLLPLVPQIWRQGLTGFAGFLMIQGNLLIAGKYLELKTVASLGLSLQIFNLIANFSGLAMRTITPRLSCSFAQGNTQESSRLLGIGIFIGWSTFFLLLILFLLIGPGALYFIKPSAHLLPMNLLLILACISFLEFNHGAIFGTYITTTNRFPFALPAFLSGFALLAVNFVGSHFFAFGVAQLICVQMLVQASYNNWKWPRLVLREINLTHFALFTMGLKEILNQMSEKHRE